MVGNLRCWQFVTLQIPFSLSLIKTGAYCSEQGVFAERLLQKRNRPCSQAPGLRVFIVMGRDEDDGNGRTSVVQPLLKFEATHSRHPDISNQTIRLQNIGRIQKLLARSEYLSPEADGIDQAFECLAHRLVVVNNRDQGIEWVFHFRSSLRGPEVRKQLYGGIRALYLGIGWTTKATHKKSQEKNSHKTHTRHINKNRAHTTRSTRKTL